LTDLAISQPDALKTLFIVMPNDREKDVVLQLRRPAVQALKSSGVEMHYIAFGDLREHCDAICKFGKDHAVMRKIAKTV
jgi:type II restriction enzyme